MLPLPTRRYVLLGLQAGPIVVEHLTKGLEGSRLDRRPDPDRFTVREVIAHLADWDPIWLARMRRIDKEQDPFLPGIDEGQLAIEHDYVHSDPTEQLDRFRTGRHALVAFLESLPDDAWERTGRREFGPTTISGLAVMALGHDGYHTRQIVEWLGA